MKSILLVEDDEDDIFMVKTACERCGFAHSFHVVRDGHQAMAYLLGDDPYSDRAAYPLPHLILLDIKMPGMNGLDLLRWIRLQPRFLTLPVVMLTASRAECDLQQAYALGLNSFLRKEENIKELEIEMRTIFDYWLGINIAPK